jgi:hypothetical protein
MDARYSWLNDLTEDWPEDALSEGPSMALPPLKASLASVAVAGRSSAGSRIPRPSSAATRSSLSHTHDRSQSALNERSEADNNIRVPTRPQSKLSRELRQPPGPQEQRLSENEDGSVAHNANNESQNRMGRSMAESLASRGSMGGSVIHNTVQVNKGGGGHNKGDTPEWRRRLVNGRSGEPADLFTNGANNLEKMFDPPSQRGVPTQQQLGGEGGIAGAHDTSTPWPSSPPAWKSLVTPAPLDELDGDAGAGEKADDSPSPSPRKPRQMQFRVNDSYDGEGVSEGLSYVSEEGEGEGEGDDGGGPGGDSVVHQP